MNGSGGDELSKFTVKVLIHSYNNVACFGE